MEVVDKYLISDNCTIMDAIKKIEQISAEIALVLFVVNEKKQIVGSLTDGDIRRGFLKGFVLTDNIKNIMRKNYCYLQKNNFSSKDVRDLKDKLIKLVPLINNDNTISGLLNLTKIRAYLPVSCVIMAGGKGIRLRPYTNDIPKPLLELNNKPIICHNIDRLRLYGVRDFHVSVNHLADKIINYLDKAYEDSDINISYIKEDIPMGTIGSLSLVNDFENEHIFVMNADLLTTIDFEDFYLNFLSSKSDLSVASFNIKIDVPYAVLDTKSERISSFTEKPTLTYYSNAGIYLFKKKLIKLIPQNQSFDAIDFMQVLIDKKSNVTHYPIRGYWLDIGKVENYIKAKEDIKHIRF